MTTSEKITHISNTLRDAVSYEDWALVERCIEELEFLCETLNLSFPFDGFDEDFYKI